MKSAQRILIVGLLAAALLTIPAFAQTSELPRHTESYSWSSGRLSGASFGAHTEGTHQLGKADMIFVPEAQWLRLSFNGARLGDASYIELTSLLDGGTQRLDSNTIRHWNYRSAYFNGDAVEIKLFLGAGDEDVYVDIREVTVGEWSVRTKSICGSADNRTSSNEPRVGRIVPVGCTGWIVDNGKHVTAGHCLSGNNADTLQFNVPASNPDRTLNHPGPEDQYPIISTSRVYRDRGVGDDWGIFAVSDNSNTGLQPIDAQNASFTVVQDLGPGTIRITGIFGPTRTTPPG